MHPGYSSFNEKCLVQGINSKWLMSVFQVANLVSGKLALRYSGKDLEAMKAVAKSSKARSLADFQVNILNSFRASFWMNLCNKTPWGFIFNIHICNPPQPRLLYYRVLCVLKPSSNRLFFGEGERQLNFVSFYKNVFLPSKNIILKKNVNHSINEKELS